MRRAFWIVSLAAVWSLIDSHLASACSSSGPPGIGSGMVCALTRFALMLALVLAPLATLARPIESGAIEVMDGDTIRAGGRAVRLGAGNGEPGAVQIRTNVWRRSTQALAPTRRWRWPAILSWWPARVGLEQRGRWCAIMVAPAASSRLVAAMLARP